MIADLSGCQPCALDVDDELSIGMIPVFMSIPKSAHENAPLSGMPLVGHVHPHAPCMHCSKQPQAVADDNSPNDHDIRPDHPQDIDICTMTIFRV